MDELKTSPYVTIDNSNNIIYDFDEIVRFVIRSYFSAMYVAASWIAGDAIQHTKPYLAKSSIVLHQKEIDRIAYRLFANSIDISKDIEERLRGYISNLLCTTNEIRPRLKGYPDVLPNESDVSKWMEMYGLNDTIRKTIDYYFDRFNKYLPIDPLDEVSKYAKPKSGCHIDSWYISQALPLIFFDTLCSFISVNAEIWLSVETKSLFSDLIAIMFAEIHYTKEDMQYVENVIYTSHNNRNKIEIACRYSQVSCDAIRFMEDYYKNVFAESKGENYFFYEGDIYDEKYSQLIERYHRQIGINESLQSLIAHDNPLNPITDDEFEFVELKFFDAELFGTYECQMALRKLLKDSFKRMALDTGRDLVAVYIAYHFLKNQLCIMKQYTNFIHDIDCLMPGKLTKKQTKGKNKQPYKTYIESLSKECEKWFIDNDSLPDKTEWTSGEYKYHVDEKRRIKIQDLVKNIYKEMIKITQR